jgi:hypothetical protein
MSKANGIDSTDFLDRAYAAWNSWKRKFLHERKREKKPFKWYEQRGLQTGAFSTFLGFTLRDCGQWEAIAVGDSCLFHIRNETMKRSFPIGHSSEFNNRPLLLSSRRTEKNDVLEAVTKTIGDWQIDDQFYLITDALACWFLEQCETSQSPWKIFRDLDTCDQKQSFEKWIGELRAKKQIRNDDVTLIRIDIALK